MSKQIYTTLKTIIKATIKHSKTTSDYKHAISTREWLLKLYPEASPELQLAALAHDIDRAVQPRTVQKANESYDDYKMRHAKRSASIMTDLLGNHNVAPENIQKIAHYITYHEVGGDIETDYLRDADSISYFADNIKVYAETHTEKQTKDKIIFMYSRTSERAQKVIAAIRFVAPYDSWVRDTIAKIG